MCDNPGHNVDHHEMIHEILDTVQDVRGRVVKMESAMYGEGTTKGLITKVDELDAGYRKQSVMVSTITSIVVAGLAALGVNIGGGTGG